MQTAGCARQIVGFRDVSAAAKAKRMPCDGELVLGMHQIQGWAAEEADVLGLRRQKIAGLDRSCSLYAQYDGR